MSKLRFGLATCDALPDWECDDDALVAALTARGVRVEQPVWTDPTVKWECFNAVLIRTTWDYATQRDRFCRWAEDVGRRVPIFNDPSCIRWNTTKLYLLELEAAGVPVIPTRLLRRGQGHDLRAEIEGLGTARGFCKPVVGSTSRETLRFDIDAAGLAAATEHLHRTLIAEDMMLQPYLDSVEAEGELSFLFVEGAFTHAVRKIPVPGDYRVQDDFGARDEPYHAPAAELDLATSVLSALPDDLLYARVDFLRDASGALLVNEVELVEPSFFFRHAPHAADTLADALCTRIRACR